MQTISETEVRSLYGRSVDSHYRVESGPIRGKPRVDRFQHARGDEREEPDCHGEYAFGTCSPAKRKKERGGNKLESPSNPFAYTMSNDIEREKENGNEREREIERGGGGDVLASSSGFRLADIPGASRRPL